MENAGLMCINLLMSLGVKRVNLAGLDGYDTENRGNYLNSGLEYDFTPEVLKIRNQLIREEMKKQREQIELNFITESVYES